MIPLRCSIRLAAMLLFFPLSALATKEAPRPNIVLILCDDMGWSDLGCYGGEIQTPNLNRLAAGGLRFTQFYNCAKCTTTRASVVTGLHPRQGKGGLLRPDMVTLGEVLKSAGYQTALSGKWHLGSQEPRRPIDRGFDECYGLLDGCCNYFNPAQRDPKFKGGRVRVFAHNEKRISEFPGDYYTTDAFTDHAIDTVRRFAATGKPFFLHLCYTAPHYPLHAPPEDIARYRGKYRKGWDEIRKERHKRQIEMGLVDPRWKLPPRDPEAPPWEEAKHKDWQDLRMAVYAAMIDRMDQNIGRLLKALEETGVAKNTLVMFLSDNGGCAETPGGEDPKRIPGPKEDYTTCGAGWACAQNTPFRRYKTWMHEGGIATPLIAHWPGRIQPGTITHQVGHIIDFLPTFAELAGGEYPSEFNGNKILPLEGRSLVPILERKERKGHETLFWEFTGNRAIRKGKWKLAWDKKVKAWELYDVEADRTEMNDLAKEFPYRVKKMSASWMEWAKETGVNLDQKSKKDKKQKREKKEKPAKKPSFIVILCDDLGYGDIGCFGSKKHRTPNIDRMAEEGTRFTSFCVTSGVCTPTRSSLMTGCYPRRVNMHQNSRGEWVLFPLAKKGLHPDEITIAEVLKEEGYRTACIGKWHLGDQPPFLPTRQGFDEYFGIPYSNDMGMEQKRPAQNPPLPLMRNETVIEAPADQNTLTQRYTREALRFIKENRDKPFFLYIPHTFPHNPVHASDRFRGKSANGLFGDSVEEIDWSTGEILKTLKKLKLDKNTLVIFTSDNGAASRWGGTNVPLRGFKGSTDEGGMRVPCVMRWPGKVPAGKTCKELATIMDLLPTFAGLAGGKPPSGRIIDGKDIWPLLEGQADAKSPHSAFYYYQVKNLRAVRSGKWKLHLPYSRTQRGKKAPQEVPARLYDLEADPGETADLKEKHPEVVQRLLGLAEKAREDLGDGDQPGKNQRPAGSVDDPQPQRIPEKF